MRFSGTGAILGNMKLALSAKITCDPKRVLENRWVHDATHVLADAVRKARRDALGREKVRK